jgi:hypothetical protein
MSPDALFKMLKEGKRLSGHTEFVVIGSLSVLGLHGVQDRIPPEMTMSIDVDVYTRADPGRIFDLLPALGEGSAFHRAHGIYLDAVSPKLPTLPQGWEARLIRIQREGVTAWFLDPHDAAVSKLARAEPRDVRWVLAGVQSGLISAPIVNTRMRDTQFFDNEEKARAAAAFDAVIAQQDHPIDDAPRQRG